MTLAAASVIRLGHVGPSTAIASRKTRVSGVDESPAVKIVNGLAQNYSSRVLAVEPNVKDLPTKLAATGLVQKTAAPQAQIHAMRVNHRQFDGADFSGGLRVDLCENWATANCNSSSLNIQRPKADYW